VRAVAKVSIASLAYEAAQGLLPPPLAAEPSVGHVHKSDAAAGIGPLVNMVEPARGNRPGQVSGSVPPAGRPGPAAVEDQDDQFRDAPAAERIDQAEDVAHATAAEPPGHAGAPPDNADAVAPSGPDASARHERAAESSTTPESGNDSFWPPQPGPAGRLATGSDVSDPPDVLDRPEMVVAPDPLAAETAAAAKALHQSRWPALPTQSRSLNAGTSLPPDTLRPVEPDQQAEWISRPEAAVRPPMPAPPEYHPRPDTPAGTDAAQFGGSAPPEAFGHPEAHALPQSLLALMSPPTIARPIPERGQDPAPDATLVADGPQARPATPPDAHVIEAPPVPPTETIADGGAATGRPDPWTGTARTPTMVDIPGARLSPPNRTSLDKAGRPDNWTAAPTETPDYWGQARSGGAPTSLEPPLPSPLEPPLPSPLEPPAPSPLEPPAPHQPPPSPFPTPYPVEPPAPEPHPPAPSPAPYPPAPEPQPDPWPDPVRPEPDPIPPDPPPAPNPMPNPMPGDQHGRYAPEDWRSHIRGTAAHSSGTVYGADRPAAAPAPAPAPAPAAAAPSPVPVTPPAPVRTGPSTPDRIARVAVIVLIIMLLVVGFIYGPQISQWLES
jgi:hypothetical protein